MIISHSKKFIFVHIQKNAGTSVTRYLDEYLTDRDLVLGCTELGEKIQPFFRRKYQLNKHSYSKRIKAYFGDEVWNDYFSFTFVRNPWSRMVSLYTWCRKNKLKYDICQDAINSESFSQFIRGKCFAQLPQQVDYFTNAKGRIIVNFVGKQESLQDDFEYVCQQISVPCPDMLKNKYNQSNPQQNYRKYYTSDQDIELVAKKFAPDIDTLGYQF